MNSQSVMIHTQLMDLQRLAGLLLVLAWAGDSPGDQGFPPGRRVQKMEKSIQEESTFHNEKKSFKAPLSINGWATCVSLPLSRNAAKSSHEHPFHLTLEMRKRVLFL